MKRLLLIFLVFLHFPVQAASELFVRYVYQENVQYGALRGEKIYPVKGNLFTSFSLSEQSIPVNQVTLLLPTEPEKVFAVGMNFASHMSSPSDQPPPLFLKLPTSLILSGEDVQAPQDALNLHFEGELVLVIGKEGKNLSESEASEAIFGVTVGNDLTERSWQGSDLQWMRAKASDGFGPVAQVIARNLDYNNLLLTTRLNGEIVQQENTRYMIHSPSKVVSYLSHYFTLKPGDLVFMGTPGRTQSLTHNDVVSVSLEGVGKVENRISFKNDLK